MKLAVKNAFMSLGNEIGLYHLLFLASHFGYVSEFRLKLDFHVNSSVDKNVNLQDFLTSPFLHDIFFSDFPRKIFFSLFLSLQDIFFQILPTPPPLKNLMVPPPKKGASQRSKENGSFLRVLRYT